MESHQYNMALLAARSTSQFSGQCGTRLTLLCFRIYFCPSVWLVFFLRNRLLDELE